MKTKNLTLALLLALLSLSRAFAQVLDDGPTPVLMTNPPPFGTFYWLYGLPSAPYPFDPAHGLLPIWSLNGVYYVDDSEFLQNLDRGAMMAMMDGPSPGEGGSGGGDTNYICNSLTNFTVGYFYSTNGLSLGIAQTTNPWIALTIQTTTTNANYDVFGTTNMVELALPSLSRTNWTWLMRAKGRATNFSWGETNWCERYFQIGSMEDADNDGLTTAYEQLVSHTSPTNANSPRAIYEGVISKQNPSNWFKLNDGSLTNAISGQSVTTLTSTATWDVDAFATGSSAIEFNGTSQRMTADDVISGGTGTNQGSMSLLFRSLNGIPTTLLSTQRYVLCQKGNANNEFGLFFETNTAPVDPGSLKVRIGSQTNMLLASNAIVFGTWYYLAITWNESNHLATWYLAPIGGTLSASNINLVHLGVTNVIGNSSNVYLGNRQSDTSNSSYPNAFRTPGNGAVDQIAFWNRELTATEVCAQFNRLNELFQGPAKVFDLSRWELTLPVNSDGQLSGADPLDISTGWLNSGFKYVDPTNWTQQYFYLSNGNTLVFAAPWNGADQDTSSNSPRSELRGTLADGSEHNWKPYDPATGVATNAHTLQATCILESVPGKVIFGQIHAETPVPTGGAVPAVTLFHEGSGTSNRIRLAVYYSPIRTPYAGNQDETYTLVSGVNVGDRIDYELKLVGTSNSNVTLTATVKTNGTAVSPRTVNMSNPADLGYSGWDATNVTLYFKAGCYFPKAATNSGTAKVTFSSLGVTHQP